MRLAYLFLLGSSLFAQTTANSVADHMLARIDAAQWGAHYVPGRSCQAWTPYQAIHATELWSDHCASHTSGLIEESFFYAFDESGPARLRLDLRPETPSPASADIARALAEKLTARFGGPDHEPEMIEIGFRKTRAGQPVSGDHWRSSALHYFVHQNQTGQLPTGVRTGVELIVFANRLFAERKKDDFILQADVLFSPEPLSRQFVQPLVGEFYISLIDTTWKDQAVRQVLAQQTFRETVGMLRVANGALLEERATLFLAANLLATKLSAMLLDTDPDASSIKHQLAAFGVKLGAMTHDGGLAYDQDLLRRVWRDFPSAQAGQVAFVELQQRGWNTSNAPGCPTNPDLFHDVIDHGEAFLAQHPSTQYRKEVLFTLAVANESWWSLALASANDGWVADIPYPRRNINRQQAAEARDKAIRYYQQIIDLAPESSEAASAARRLPRLKLGLDTGQRRFFCSYC